jgi:uncharacterized RDD family membrane protein YckC
LPSTGCDGRADKESTLKEKPKEYALEYAGFWIRLAASLIDFLLLIVALYILYCVISQSFFWIFPGVNKIVDTFGAIARGAPVSAGLIWLLAIVLLIFLAGSTVYFVVCWATTGQTVGKLSMSIKIIRTDSSPLDLRIASIRFLGSLLCMALLGIGFIIIAFDSRKQGLHDRIADTYVVKLPVKSRLYIAGLWPVKESGDMTGQVRVRFAPSPTGHPHLGNIRTALFNWLFARHNQGVFILRIEDTDQARKVEGATENIMAGLKWLGMDWDEGPYFQSQRLDMYQKYAQQLVDEGKAYYCFCQPERLDKMRQEQVARKLPPGYDRHCRELTEAQVEVERRRGTVPVVRFKSPLEGKTAVTDLIRGEVVFDNNTLDDFVLLKSDGYPTYHLANIVDDHI